MDRLRTFLEKLPSCESESNTDTNDTQTPRSRNKKITVTRTQLPIEEIKQLQKFLFSYGTRLIATTSTVLPQTYLIKTEDNSINSPASFWVNSRLPIRKFSHIEVSQFVTAWLQYAIQGQRIEYPLCCLGLYELNSRIQSIKGRQANKKALEEASKKKLAEANKKEHEKVNDAPKEEPNKDEKKEEVEDNEEQMIKALLPSFKFIGDTFLSPTAILAVNTGSQCGLVKSFTPQQIREQWQNMEEATHYSQQDLAHLLEVTHDLLLGEFDINPQNNSAQYTSNITLSAVELKKYYDLFMQFEQLNFNLIDNYSLDSSAIFYQNNSGSSLPNPADNCSAEVQSLCRC